MSPADHWATSTVGQLFTVVGGGTPSTERSEFWGGSTPWISSADLDDNFNLHPRRSVTEEGLANSPGTAVPMGSVVVATRVGLGKVGLVRGMAACFSQDCQALLLPKDIHPRFAAYQLKWLAGRFLERSRGTTIPGITKKQLVETPFRVPPFPEQIRIAEAIDELLSDLDAGAAAMKQVRVKLAHYRASVLRAGIEGKLTSEWREQHPNTEPASELLKRALAVRRHRWEEEQFRRFKERGQEPPTDWKAKYKEPIAPDTTSLPPLPDGWCWGSWPQVGSSKNGRPFPSREYQAEGVKLLRPGNLYANGAVGWTDRNTRFMPDKYAEESPDLIVGGGQLIINLTAQSLKDDFLGRVCMTSEGERCLLNQRLARLAPCIILPRFMLWLFKSAHFRQFVSSLNVGSLIQHMFTSQLENYVFPLPPLDEQPAIVEAIENQLSVIEHLEADLDAKIESAQALRHSILRHAFTGQLVAQDPNDEPASELLKRIAAEREARVGAAKRTPVNPGAPRAAPRRPRKKRTKES